ncbi:YkgJ family cysteine cluster protein|uniref:YkgJ family cysteine cluster protein n=1 Tax=Dendrosporobacter quercicolus TaxID=146817 RepID=UPI000B88B2C3|nr:YkgJ family cysteine cluster protein [Dendrosporobacter quercicolus]NSL49832.1 YkgJ family cysteine cluster protein [Dendrosporobacter quercicolus DSM 1736]
MDFCRPYLDCAACPNNCCAGFIVYPDPVFTVKLTATARKTMDEYDSSHFPLRAMRLDHQLRWFLPPGPDGYCKFLSPAGRCLIYEARPLVCCLHTCLPCTGEFTAMKNRLYFAGQQALVLKMQNLIAPQSAPPPVYRPWDNPLVTIESYDVLICDILRWSQAAGAFPGNGRHP